MSAAALSLLLSAALDAAFGDPAWLPHPVVLMGRAISALERLLRRGGADRARDIVRGRVLAAVVPLGSLAVSAAALAIAWAVHPLLAVALDVFWGAQCLAARGLASEAASVERCLTAGDLPAARVAVGRIVGRDTAALDARGVTAAAVETVAENFSDGVVAPLLYLILGGSPLALAYKAVNTADSMVGYKNERYLWFGRAAAHLDDVANWVPARLAALLWIAASALTGADARASLRIWRRDRARHASPNSAQTESACAGSLGVRLAGPASYFGKRVDKPYIGDDTRPLEAADITRACRIMVAGSVLAAVLGALVRCAVVALVGKVM